MDEAPLYSSMWLFFLEVCIWITWCNFCLLSLFFHSSPSNLMLLVCLSSWSLMHWCFTEFSSIAVVLPQWPRIAGEEHLHIALLVSVTEEMAGGIASYVTWMMLVPRHPNEEYWCNHENKGAKAIALDTQGIVNWSMLGKCWLILLSMADMSCYWLITLEAELQASGSFSSIHSFSLWHGQMTWSWQFLLTSAGIQSSMDCMCTLGVRLLCCDLVCIHPHTFYSSALTFENSITTPSAAINWRNPT